MCTGLGPDPVQNLTDDPAPCGLHMEPLHSRGDRICPSFTTTTITTMHFNSELWVTLCTILSISVCLCACLSVAVINWCRWMEIATTVVLPGTSTAWDWMIWNCSSWLLSLNLIHATCAVVCSTSSWSRVQSTDIEFTTDTFNALILLVSIVHYAPGQLVCAVHRFSLARWFSEEVTAIRTTRFYTCAHWLKTAQGKFVVIFFAWFCIVLSHKRKGE